MDKKHLIETLFKEKSEYLHPEQAITTASLLDTVSSDIYSESQRFVFELIQNADDSANSDNEVHFDFQSQSLIVSHNGNVFSIEDIKSITSAGASTKKADASATGYKGIGFKSVFGKSERVTIFSDGFQFRFDKAFHQTILPWQIIPIWTEIVELPSEVKEFIEKNQYPVSTIIETGDIETLQNDLKELLSNSEILLFLRNITKISISQNSNPVLVLEKKIMNKTDNYNEVSIYKDTLEISSWLTMTFEQIPVPESTKLELQKDEKTPKKLKDARHTEISFAIKKENDKLQKLKDQESVIFTYLPTKVGEFNFPFLVNGNFLTNASREAIHNDKIWNQWLFSIVAEKLVDCMMLLTDTKYKFQTLHLFPSTFNGATDPLKKSFAQSFLATSKTKPFVITESGNIKKTSDVIIDKTGLSNQNFIDSSSILEFFNSKYNLSFSNDCFVNSKIENRNKLEKIAVRVFGNEEIQEFFESTHFQESQKITDNFDLIKYLKELSDADKSGVWFETLEILPFIFNDKEQLSNPSTGVCFPGPNEFELGEVPVIHNIVFEKIQNTHYIFEWLKTLGVIEPSKIVYVRNVLVPNLHTENFITHENFLEITHYLFNLFHEHKLDDAILGSLREFKLKINGSNFEEAQKCFLSNQYNPKLKLEEVIKEDIKFVSEDYLSLDDSEQKWYLFFKAIQVKDRVEIEVIDHNNTLPALRPITNIDWVDGSRIKAESEKPPNAFGFEDQNIIANVRIPSFLNLISINIDYCKLFWKDLINNPVNYETLFGVERKAVYKYGVGRGRNRYEIRVENYFNWFLENRRCIPTSTEEILSLGEVFLNLKEIKEAAGSHLPVFDYDGILPEHWIKVLNLKKELQLEDYLEILKKISEKAEQETGFKVSKTRIGFIYNRIANLLPNITEERKQTISDWAKTNKLLSNDLTFISPNQLKWITIEGFSLDHSQIKTILLPGNLVKDARVTNELFSLLNIQIIDKFTPKFNNSVLDKSLKTRIQKILPYLSAIIQMNLDDGKAKEFERIFEILNDIDFYQTDDIVISFDHQLESIEGPSLATYSEENKFYFKGKWSKERILMSLIKELTKLIGAFGYETELRFLLMETDNEEVLDWIMEKGIDIETIEKEKVFTIHVEVKEYVIPDQDTITTFDVPNDEYKSSDPSFKSAASFVPKVNPGISQAQPLRKQYEAEDNSDSNIQEFQEMANEEDRLNTGNWSESFVSQNLHSWGNYSDIIWENEHGESGKPYDFQVIENGTKKYIEVKGTPSGDKNIIYLSSAEWKWMHTHKENYLIIRIYNAGEEKAHPHIIDNPSSLIESGKLLIAQVALKV